MGKKSKRQWAFDLKFKDQVEDLFLVKNIQQMEGRDGRNYLAIILADSSGEIEARMWHKVAETTSDVPGGSFVFVQGKINQYQGKKQLIISDITHVEREEVIEDEFIPKATRPAEDMFSDLLKIIAQLDDVYIRDLLNLVTTDFEIKRRLMLWPAGKSIHHAYQSGLLEHILSCSELACILAPKYRLNRNYVVAGAILHDLCKIYELSDGAMVEYTDEGKLVGHLAKGLEIIDRFSSRIKNFPNSLKIHLKHILLSHHGELEYGSPKTPVTSEAYLVHLIDYLDSKMSSLETIKRNDSGTGNWSAFNKHLERSIFKSELPFFPEYLNVGGVSDPNSVENQASIEQKMQLREKRKEMNRGENDLKQSMSKFFENVKVEDK